MLRPRYGIGMRQAEALLVVPDNMFACHAVTVYVFKRICFCACPCLVIFTKHVH